MAIDIDPERFDALVEQALAEIPEELLGLMDNCAVIVEDSAPEDDPGLLGLYEGVPLTERGSDYAGFLPDCIRIFRDNIVAFCADEDEVIDEIYITVVHEIAHHFGIDDDRLDELGYA